MKNTQGFGIVELLLVLIILGGIGAAGYSVYTHNKKPSSGASTQLAQETENEQTTSPTLYLDETRLPDGWVKVDGIETLDSTGYTDLSLQNKSLGCHVSATIEAGISENKYDSAEEAAYQSQKTPPKDGVSIKELESGEITLNSSGNKTAYKSQNTVRTYGEAFSSPDDYIAFAYIRGRSDTGLAIQLTCSGDRSNLAKAQEALLAVDFR